MKMFRKLLSAVALVAAFGGTAQASIINIGGVTWDPDAVSITDSDFTARYEFNQFFSSSANAVSNALNAAPNYANAINPLTVGFGDVLQGVGEIFKFNGVNYGDTSSAIGGAFCASCELTFVFGGFQIAGPGTFTNGWLRLYVDDTPDFNVSTSPAGNAADGNLFLQLSAVANEFSNATSFQSGFLTSYFAVTGGIAASNFDTNTQQFMADLLSSASSQFSNNNFIATSTGQISGNSIPEPSTVLLLSLALMGLAMTRRQTKNK
ncbi:PEP-CTERM sorting domain-containing protein [Noviherbaspirillum sp.]|uniref:PEP-CTERM sorting domain-containing protein n=1 Tax=Noviherbaspirillum sp. TaxID=1926288 RepID=UPI002FE2CABC